MKFGEDGRLYAVNPEAGFFGVAPGHEPQDQPERDGHDRAEHDLHQLRAHRRRRRLVGGHDRASRPRTRSTGRATTGRPTSDEPAAHPNARFTTPAAQCPSIAPEWEDPDGRADRRLPVRRPARRPWCRWSPRRSTGSTASSSARRCRSETTAAAAGEVGELRFDPMAMLPFCGYNMADYFGHWLQIGRRARDAKLPRIFLRQLVPQGRRRQVHLAGLRREQPRAGVGLPPLRRRGRRRSRPRSASFRGRRARHRRPRLVRGSARGAPRGRPRRCGGAAPAGEEHLARFGDPLPDEISPAQLESLAARLQTG